MSQQQQQPSPYRTYQPQPQPSQSNVASAALGDFISNFETPRRRLSDLSDVPTAELYNWSSDPQLVQQKHDSIATKLVTDPSTRQMMLNQCAIHTPHLLQELQDHLSSLGALPNTPPPPACQNDAELSQSEAQMVKEIVADQKRLEFASQRYREAGEAFHFWETEIYQINARMKTREALAEAGRKAKKSSQ
ncbi:hypothetical protein H9Q69_011040 [Fusarium xylarioides]|nr:hypothetical protein H9Q69_011040 [Fusarium xylarioides]